MSKSENSHVKAEATATTESDSEQEVIEEDYSGWYVEFSEGLKRSVPPRMVLLRDLERVVQEAKKKGADADVDLFTSVFRYPSTDPYIGPVIGGLVFDLDDPKDPERARKEAVKLIEFLKNDLGIREDSIDVAFSGSKGFSIVVNRRVFGFEPSETLPLIHKSMAKEILETLSLDTLDSKIYERRRLWRVPDTRNSRSMRYKVRLTPQELEGLDFDKIWQIALQPRPQVPKPGTTGVIHRLSERARAFYLKHKAEVEKELSNKPIAFAPTDFKGAIPICLASILNEGVDEGQRNASAFALSVFFAGARDSEQAIKARLLKWNRLNRPPLEDREIERTVESAIQGVVDGRYSVGCSNTILAEHCDIARCQIVKGGAIPPPLREKAEELLRDPEIIHKILHASERQLTKDESLRTLEILVMASTFGPSPVVLQLSQVWSSGRTAITVAMADLLPDDRVWFLGALSPTALVHERGEWEEEKGGFVVNLEGKLLVFLENPDPKTYEKLRPLLSHDRPEIPYRFTDRTPKGSLRTMTSILRGWPGVIFCGSQMPATAEYSSRWITASPDVTGDKIGAVIERSGLEMKTPKQFEKGEEFAVVRAAFQILGENMRWKVTASFGDLLAKYFRKKDPTDMRRFKQFRDLICASTILHAFQREKDEDGNLKSVLGDVEIAYDCLKRIETTSIYGIGQHIIDYWNGLKAIKEKGTYPIPYDQATSKFQEIFKRPVSKTWLHEGYLKPLEQAGLIDFQEDPEDKRKKNILVLEGKQEPLFDFEGFMKEAKERERFHRTIGGDEDA